MEGIMTTTFITPAVEKTAWTTTSLDSIRSGLEVLLTNVVQTVCEWRRRARSRRQLAMMGERDYADLPFSRSEISAEMNKPFWRA